MKCKCGNEIVIRMTAKVESFGCKILTSLTTIMTVECNECGEKFQIPIQTNNYISKDKE